MPDKKPEETIQEPTKEEQEENTSRSETETQKEQSEHYEGMVDDAIRGAMSDDESS